MRLRDFLVPPTGFALELVGSHLRQGLFQRGEALSDFVHGIPVEGTHAVTDRQFFQIIGIHSGRVERRADIVGGNHQFVDACSATVAVTLAFFTASGPVEGLGWF